MSHRRALRSVTRLAVTLLTSASVLLLLATPASAFSPTNGSVHYLRQDVSIKCLDVVGAATYNGAGLQRFTCGPQWNQQWIFADPGYPTGVLSWRIKPRYLPNKCLDVAGGSHTSGTRLQIWDCNAGWQQRFVINPGWSFLPYDNFVLKTSYANLCLTIQGNGFSDGGTAQARTCDGSAGQLFTTSPPEL